MKKQIYILIGQKGSGKSFVGHLFDLNLNIPFLRVEDIALQVKVDRDIDDDDYIREVFRAIEAAVRNKLVKSDSLVFESTGLSEHFEQMLLNLKDDFNVTMIGIHTDKDLCIKRVHERDQLIHINVSDPELDKINQMVRDKNRVCDFKIDNNSSRETELIEKIRSIILQG